MNDSRVVANIESVYTGFIIISSSYLPPNQTDNNLWSPVPVPVPVAGSRLWNNLPYEVTSAPTLPVFSSRLKTYLFQLSPPPD